MKKRNLKRKILDELIKKAQSEEWDVIFDELEKEPPQIFDTFMREYICEHNNGEYPDFEDQIQERIRWLDSSKRRLEYYNSIPEGDMTDYDWSDFRTCTW